MTEFETNLTAFNLLFTFKLYFKRQNKDWIKTLLCCPNCCGGLVVALASVQKRTVAL